MKHLEVRQKYSTARRIFNSLLGVSSGDETLRLMFDILLEEAGLDIPLPANNTKGRRQLTELESVSHALSVNLRMTVVLLKITLFSYFILCFMWHKMRASKSNHWSSDLFMRHKVWLQKRLIIKRFPSEFLPCRPRFIVSPSLIQDRKTVIYIIPGLWCTRAVLIPPHLSKKCS